METAKILSATILDLIFEERNKSYGAYELRKFYNKRLTLAFMVMLILCMFFFIITLFANKQTVIKPILTNDVNLSDYTPKEEKIVSPPPPPPLPKTNSVKTKKFVEFIIMKDELVNEPLPTQNELEFANIGFKDAEGKDADEYVGQPVEIKGTGIVEPLKQRQIDVDARFTKVEKEARFPGGAGAWKKYLERSLNAQVATEEGASVGTYKVGVSFLVDKDGNISNVIAQDISTACKSCGIEAVRVIKKGPGWEPAIQNGQKVSYQVMQYITFQVLE